MSRCGSPLAVGIAGAGIIGMSLAWRLAQAGFSVSVYEKSKVGGEASWAGAGMLAPGGEFEEDSFFSRVALESRAMYPAFIRELERASETAIDLQENGSIDLAYSDVELDALEGRVKKQLAIGIEAKRIDSNQIRAFWPRIQTDKLAGGFFYAKDAVVDPREVMAALRIAVERRGVRVIESCSVLEATAGKDSVKISTDAGDFEHNALVIAAGAWSSSIVLHDKPCLPKSEPVRGHLLGYRQPAQTCQTIVRHRDTYMLQRANGLLITGASVEHAGFDRGLDEGAIDKLRRRAEFMMPHLSETSPTEVWNGLRPGSDALHIGSWQSSHIYLAYGHYRNGILLAPATATLLTQEISANLQRR